MARPTKQELERRRQRQQQWLAQFLPRVLAAKRPNSTFLEHPEVLELLQHLSDGVNELLMARPLAPRPWLADYLRRACKLAYQVEATPVESLVLEMHRKRRVIQRVLRDTKLHENESKRLVRRIIALEQELQLVGRERRLKKADHEFLASQKPSIQANWSIDTSKVPLLLQKEESRIADPTNTQQEEEPKQHESEGAWLAEQLRLDLQAQRDLDSYFDGALDLVVQALVALLLAAPENPALWLVLYLRYPTDGSDHSASSSSVHLAAAARRSSAALLATSPLLFRTNYELTLKLEELREGERLMLARLERMQLAHSTLELELTTRDRFVTRLSETHVTTRTQAIMDGTPVFLNAQKHWVLPGFLLNPRDLSAAELLGLRRAESVLMERDERHWKFLIRSQQEYDAATLVQSSWRGGRALRLYKELVKTRRRAASVIQRNYFQYLYTRAVSLPRWCRPGREVIVAPSIALKCAISFQFYAKRDFPTGNYRREPPGTTVTQLMALARQDEQCAGFTTDGALKRFLPRKLSQLKAMLAPPSSELSMTDGLYVKLYPNKSETVVNTAIILEIPEDRFGLIQVVLDGIAITELVPLAKLSDRWKRVRVKRLQSTEKKTRAFVFGKAASAVNEEEEPADTASYERLESDEEEGEDDLEKRWRRQRRLQQQEAAEATDYIYEDLATGRIVRHGHPDNTHEDPEARIQVIETRKQVYEAEKGRALEAKKLASTVKLQCAWRSKRARADFRQMLVLRAKEKERERLVEQVGAANAHRQPAKKPEGAGSSFFSRWRRS
ncbi:hypothetical protein BBJ28_00015345 [Nothophytophthora sp. Chile5]|nr:hypothetical protein BBJ28_00015345 [Nothophytophthora sp. Chile5]